MDFHRARSRSTRRFGICWVVAGLLTAAGCGSSDDNPRADTVPSVPSTTTTGSTDCVELLDRGCTGPTVERLQRLLRSRIDQNIDVDGTFGPRTEEVLISFEDFRCPTGTCTVDGRIVVNDPEWAALVALEELPPRTSEPSP